MRKVLLLEDDQSLGLTLKERLHREGLDVRLVTSLNEGRQALKDHFDLFILDVGLPDGSGFDFAQELRRQTNSPFLFMTAQSDAESRLKGYEAGAEEFIPKPFHLKEFLLRVRHVMENHAVPHTFSLAEGVVFDFDSFQIVKDGTTENLTQKEAHVLHLLISSAPKVVSRDEILDRVWGEEAFPSQRTIDNVILKLRSLLGDAAGARIQSVRGVGYKWV